MRGASAVFGGNSNYRKIVINTANQKGFGLVEMTCGLVHASYSLPEWQAVKLTFFAPCEYLDFPSLICLIKEINDHYCGQIHPTSFSIPTNRAHPKRDSARSNNRLNNVTI